MPTDHDYLAQLQDYYATQRALPSIASLGQLVGLRSRSSAAALANRLKLAGFLATSPDRPRPRRLTADEAGRCS